MVFDGRLCNCRSPCYCGAEIFMSWGGSTQLRVVRFYKNNQSTKKKLRISYQVKRMLIDLKLLLLIEKYDLLFPAFWNDLIVLKDKFYSSLTHKKHECQSNLCNPVVWSLKPRGKKVKKLRTCPWQIGQNTLRMNWTEKSLICLGRSFPSECIL